MSNETTIRVKDNSQRLQDEVKLLLTKNKPLSDLIFDLAEHIADTYNKELVITMIDRTQEEQDAIYKDDAKYKVKKFKSPHQFWQAVDIRSSIFKKDEITAIEKHLNEKYNPSNECAWTARNHVVGKGAYHFHIQYVEKKKKNV